MNNLSCISRKSFLFLSFIFMVLFIISFNGNTANASNLGANEKAMSKNGKVHSDMYDKISKNMDDYLYSSGFILTRYTPHDSTEVSWLSQSLSSPQLSLNGGKFYPVHFFEKGGKTYMSSISIERAERTLDKYPSAKKEAKTVDYQGAPRKYYILDFGQKLSTEKKKALLPLGCQAHIQGTGVFWAGSFEVVDWGSVAADVTMQDRIFKARANLYIENYGYGQVHDQGGAIRGKHLDLFSDNCTEALSGGKTKNAIVIYKKSEVNSYLKSSGSKVTKDILDKVNKSKKWGENNSTVSDSDSDDSTTESSKKDTSSEGGNYEWFDPFKKQSVAINQNTGSDKVNLVIPTEVSYGLTVFSSFVSELLNWVMILLSVVMITMFALQILSIVLLTRNGSGNITDKVTSVAFGKDLDVNADNYKKVLLVNLGTVVLIIALSLSAFYFILQQEFYQGLISLLDFIF